MSVVIVSCHSASILYRAHHLTISHEQTTTRTFLIQPDQFQTNGNLITATGKDSQGQKYLVRGQIASKEQLQTFHQITKPFLLQVSGTIQPISCATNENQFNSQTYYRNQGIFNQIMGPARIADYRAPGSFTGWLHVIRAKCALYFRTFPAPLNLFCTRLLLGINDNELSSTIKQVQKLGVVHLFCLSGLHVNVLCVLIQKALSFINCTKEKICYLQLIGLPIFWVIGGSSISLTRAVIMIELSILAQCLHRSDIDTWSICLLLHLCFVPGVLMNIGGQLSYLLSFALSRVRWKNVWQQTMGLELIGLPVLIHSTFQFHILSVLLNLILIPLFSTVILPCVLFCAVAGHFIPASVLIVNDGLLRFQHLLEWLGNLPGLIIFGKIPSCISLVLLILTLLIFDLPKFKRPFILFTFMIYLTCFLIIRFPIHGEVVFFDIGQGDSILIREPFNRRIMLIDTGGHLNFKTPQWKKRVITSDDAQRISINYLKSKGISSVDAVLLSHSDADHVGNITTICRELNVKSIMVPLGMESMTKLTRRLPKQVPVVPVTDQSEFNNLPLTVLHPFKRGKGANEDSMVLWGGNLVDARLFSLVI